VSQETLTLESNSIGLEQREKRRVKVTTINEVVEGYLCVGRRPRTLDALNLAAPLFLVVDVDRAPREGSFFERGRVGISTSTILFVCELTEFHRDDGRVEAARFVRSPVRLQVGGYQIQGFMHVPGRGDPMTRLNQLRHPFIAMTSASVMGPDSQFAAPFLAVNRYNISAAQEIVAEETELEAEFAVANTLG
jgi:hypothetical protein